MSKTYVIEIDGEMKYITLSEEKIEYFIRSYLEYRISRDLPI